MQELQLDTGWELKERSPEQPIELTVGQPQGWLPARVPGLVQQDLLAAGRIPDPFVGLHEQDVQWIGERDWLYRCRFTAPADIAAAPHVELCCEGLDTFATLWLNGERILVADNMFLPYRVPIKQLLRAGDNELLILFESALRRGKERAAEHGGMAVWNGDPSRIYVRKAQYHYGWDWGPTLLTAGPWRPVRIEAYTARIVDLACPIMVSEDLSQAELQLVATIAGEGEDYSLDLELLDPAGERVAHTLVERAGAQLGADLLVEQPQLWWPHGYGAQPLYRLRATLLQHGRVVDQREQRLGLRRLRLVQEPMASESGSSFMFEINNTALFCGGANWIPADSLLTRIPVERYRAQLQDAVDANMLMLRVWGGGIYEQEVFYDLCDELGLLVWQDFMFACGIYPAAPWFQENVAAEVDAQVRRLRHHPSIVLWCGNNEDYQVAESLKAYDRQQPPAESARFPARLLYEELIPELCARLDPQRPYWPGSAYGGASVQDQTVGDRHTWEIWHGPMAPYQDYARYAGRFVSEFGMQALPDPATVAVWAAPEERYPQSRSLEHHNKAEGGSRRIAVYLSDNLRPVAGLEEYIYATQLIQAEALGSAYRSFRRRWGGPGHQAVAGALVWQLNDCWPCTSWAIIDYELRRKPAYYVIRRELAALALGLRREEQGIAIWAVNGGLQSVAGLLELRAWSLDGALLWSEERAVSLAANQASELAPCEQRFEQQVVLAARLRAGGAVQARAALWPEPFKYLQLPDPAIEVTLLDAQTLRLRASRPAKGVFLAAGARTWLSDNMLDLLPDDEQTLTVRQLDPGALQVRWLGQEHHAAPRLQLS